MEGVPEKTTKNAENLDQSWAKPGWLRRPKNGVSVVFIHGLRSQIATAWGTGGISWPELLRNERDLEDIGIYLFEYPSDPRSGNYALSYVTDALQDSLERDGVLRSRRIIFVGHSQGGIVARKYVVSNQALLLRRRVEIGMFLVASPSLGSRLASCLTVSILARIFDYSQLEGLRFGRQELKDLDKDFMNLVAEQGLPIAGRELIEHRRFWLLRIVEDLSAARYFGRSFKVPNSNHITIAKPGNCNALQHRQLCDFISKYSYRIGKRWSRNKVQLRIGLSSESPETISWMLGVCKNVMNVALGEPDIDSLFDFAITPKDEYHDAFTFFDRNLQEFDIVMVDDLWLQPFDDRLMTLSSLASYQDYFRTRRFEDVFLESLTGACTRADGVFAIPVSGNVQLLMYREDLIEQAGASGAELPRDPDKLLDFILTDRARAVSEVPFIVRNESGNDLAENFWEILRAYGYEETVGQHGEVLIPATLAQKAFEWLRKAHPTAIPDQYGWKAGRSMASGEAKAMMMFGWPVWVLPDLIRNPDWSERLGMKQFLKQPITGFWSFAIPTKCKFPEQAMDLILALAANPDLQNLMAEGGLVPVLNHISEANLKRRYPVWKKNFDILRTALRNGKPRPRHPHWQKIEEALAEQIRYGEFTDKKGLFRFVEDTQMSIGTSM